VGNVLRVRYKRSVRMKTDAAAPRTIRVGSIAGARGSTNVRVHHCCYPRRVVARSKPTRTVIQSRRFRRCARDRMHTVYGRSSGDTIERVRPASD